MILASRALPLVSGQEPGQDFDFDQWSSVTDLINRRLNCDRSILLFLSFVYLGMYH